jgi:hypothetical protein
MKTTILILLLTLLGANLAAADQSTMRYDLSGELLLILEQDIYPGGRTEPLAGRRFEMTFAISGARDDNPLNAKLTAIKASYEAHGMNQRLSVSHLEGQQVVLGNDGRVISLDDPGAGIDMGAITDGDLHPSALLVDVLPALPDGPVTPGLTWETEQAVRSLEGWAWAGGDMRYRHEVTDVSTQDGNTVVYVQSHGQTTVTAASGTQGFLGSGSLQRHVEWSFNTTTGRLVSLSMEQEGQGTNELPQGQVSVRQVTRVELRGAI